jgi:hypothetical protein
LDKNEIEKLGDLTNLFLDSAETEAKEQRVLRMSDWIEITDDLLNYRKKNVLKNSGNISREMAVRKAENEYDIFKIRQDKEFISTMDLFYEKYLEKD